MVSMRNYEQVFIKLMRRYKYLEKMFEEEMKKILLFIKGFSDIERVKLARMTTLWISNGSIPPTVLQVLTNVSLNLNLILRTYYKINLLYYITFFRSI